MLGEGVAMGKDSLIGASLGVSNCREDLPGYLAGGKGSRATDPKVE